MWELVSNTCGAKLSFKQDNYNGNSNSDYMGAGGVRSFTYETLPATSNYIRGQPCKLTYAYKRPWMNEAVDMKEVTITLN